MTEDLLEVGTKNQGQVVKVARIMAGLTQKELIKQCDFPVTQGYWSKVEQGLLSIHAALWEEIVHYFKFNSYFATKNGYLESAMKSLKETKQVNNIGYFKIPKRYSMEQGSTVRTALPLLLKGYSALGPKVMDGWIESLKFKPLYFRALNNPLNLNFFNDLLAFLIERRVINPNSISLNEAISHNVHGSMSSSYGKAVNEIELVKKIIKNSDRYQFNHSYEVHSFDPKKIVFTITERYHCKEFHPSNELKLAGHLYRVAYFKKFVHFDGRDSKAMLRASGDHQECQITISA